MRRMCCAALRCAAHAVLCCHVLRCAAPPTLCCVVMPPLLLVFVVSCKRSAFDARLPSSWPYCPHTLMLFTGASHMRKTGICFTSLSRAG